MILVIVGAGASFDSVSLSSVVGSDYRWRPPVTKDLFDPLPTLWDFWISTPTFGASFRDCVKCSRPASNRWKLSWPNLNAVALQIVGS